MPSAKRPSSRPAAMVDPADAVATPPRVSFVSLGCPKNLVDSEKMLGALAEDGCLIGAPEDDADVVVINTCGFLKASQDEAVDVIREAVERKRAGQVRHVVVAGCLVSRLGEKLRDVAPELADVDSLVGVNNRSDVLTAVRTLTGAQPAGTLGVTLPIFSSPGSRVAGADFVGPTTQTFVRNEHVAHVLADTARVRLTPRHYAYLRMSEGCNQRCTFCTIPSIRGRMTSKPLPMILDEASELFSDGALELNLIGQDTTSYGDDIGYSAGLAGLIRELDQFASAHQPNAWLRLMYAYPSTFTDEMIAALADARHFVKYIDMPLQHISDRVLKAMHRRVTREQTVTLIQRLRAAIPELSLRTTFIVGFPGETDAEFEELLEFVRHTRFDMLGVFVYSPEPGTPAARMKDHVPPEVMERRKNKLMQLQQDLAFTRAENMLGKQLRVLVDSKMGRGLWAGRHAGQAPEIDSITVIKGRCQPGELVDVKITARDGYDLVGEVVR